MKLEDKLKINEGFHKVIDDLNALWTMFTISEATEMDKNCIKCGKPLHQHVGTGREWICPEEVKK